LNTTKETVNQIPLIWGQTWAHKPRWNQEKNWAFITSPACSCL